MKVPSFLRDFDRKAEMLGFKFVGLTGNTHPRYHNADIDVTVTAPLTPSDWRSQANTLANMERLSGRKLPRGNSGHHSHKPVRTVLNTNLSDTEAAAVERATALVSEADDLREKWYALLAGPTNRTTAGEARNILDSYERVRRKLETLHRIIPPLAVA